MGISFFVFMQHVICLCVKFCIPVLLVKHKQLKDQSVAR